METQHLDKLAEEIAELKTKKTEYESLKNSIGAELEKKQQQLIERLVEINKTSWELKDVGSFSIVRDNRFKIADRDKLVEFCLSNDEKHLLSVNHQTLNAWANQQKGLVPEAAGLDYQVHNKISFRRKKS